MTPKEVATNLIEHYVRRGDSFASLKSGQMGSSSDTYCAAIGGYADGKRIGNDKIIVSRIGKKECLYIFKLQDIMDSILSGQQSLFA